ncbi:hypothetical protein [Streptobacillus felis]|uniref:hypothetical protein n=1 Tax=Streptobacillus felis TaxID=1384509 RepID=UPI0022AAB445|nr:hypothetical protein [Streptobacillus felis]
MHAIVSLSGFNKYFEYKKLNYFHVNSIANQWKFLLCNLIKNGNYPKNIIKQKAINIVNFMYKKRC